MIGETFSHYRILEKLGEGGMGEVWKAVDTRLDREVALKFVPEKTAGDAQTVDRFLREARAASAMNHPHICTIFDIGEWEGRRYIVMELLEGRTLRDAVSLGALRTEAIVDLGIQIADALDAAHAKNIVHRDIKATNIIVSDRGQAKILDFGLAKLANPGSGAQGAQATAATVAQDITDPGATVGTIQYMSPEQALGKDVDGRSDIFSLGVVLYELATGRPAFRGDTSAAVFDAILNRAPVAPVDLNPELPRELERIINKCLEKDRDMRYQGAAELAADLKRLKRDSSSQSVQSAALAAPARAARRPSWAKWAFGGLIVAAAAVVTIVLVTREPSAPEKQITIRPLTGQIGYESSPTWSPDGSFFAYARAESGPLDIYVVASGGGDPITLVQSPSDDFSPSWSPDGRWIAFISNRGGMAAIYKVPPLGGGVQKLVDTGVPGLSDRAYDVMGSNPWSPDGKRFLFARAEAAGNLALWIMDLDSGKETRVTQPASGVWDAMGSWSHEGDRIVFGRYQEGQVRLVVRDLDAGREEVVLNDGQMNLEPGWSNDDGALVYVSLKGGNQNLWAIDLDRKRPRQLTNGRLGSVAPRVGRNGDIIFSSASHQTDLYLQDLAGGNQRRLTQHTEDNFVPKISPDGTRAAYMSSRTGNAEIWILDLAGGGERQLTSNSDEDYSPVWSPDGTMILYVSVHGGRPALWIADASGGAPRRFLEAGPSQQSGPRWSPDGAVIGFLTPGETGNELWFTDPDGGEPHKVMGGVGEYDFYRDSRHVIYTPSTQGVALEMRARDLDSEAETILINEPHRELEVAPDGSAVSYLSSTSHFNMNLFVLRLTPTHVPDGLPLVMSKPERVTEGKGLWHVHNGGWSSDAKQVIYTRDTDAGDILLMTGAF